MLGISPHLIVPGAFSYYMPLKNTERQSNERAELRFLLLSNLAQQGCCAQAVMKMAMTRTFLVCLVQDITLLLGT